MRASLVNLAVFVSSFPLLRAAQLTDVCGEVSSVLKLPSLALPHKVITYGTISECLCISHIPSYVASSGLTIPAVASAGRTAVINSITQMVNSCKKQTCHYPPHSIPQCQHGNPCGFTCTDGFIPFPAFHPTACACNKPYTLCNGKCALFKACPSGRPVYKRGLEGGLDKCPEGLTSCPVPGRDAHSKECVNTQSDLESCGGCVLPFYHKRHLPEGVDCTSIQGVSDVSCMHGQCVVHRCMFGYTPNNLRDSCVRSDDESEIVLADD